MKIKVFDKGSPSKELKGFAPELLIPNGIIDVSFYEKAFGAVEQRRFSNDDGSVHVSEFSVSGTLFHLHEQTQNSSAVSPHAINGGTTVVIGLFVDDVHAIVEQAVVAGALLTSPVQDYEYGYRQGTIRDPFGHLWQIQKAI